MAADRTPVWFMRQAGRVLPEYRAARKTLSLMELYADPRLAARLGTAPVERFEVDAAAVVTDLRLPLVAMGLHPVLRDEEEPGRGDAPSALRLRAPTDADFGALPETVQLTAREVAGRATVLAQVGAPFTLAASVLDPARPSDASRLRALVYGEPERWAELAEVMTSVSVRAAELQVEAGAQAVHVYDTWAGVLEQEDYRQAVLPWSRRLFEAIARAGVPAIHYVLGGGHLLEALREAGGNVIGIDWRVDLEEAWSRIGPDRGLQGNLDPTVLIEPTERVLAHAADIVHTAGGRPGFIFSLGHGLLPSTPASTLHALARYVHSLRL